MSPELGHFALVLALVAALAQTLIPAWGLVTRNARLQAVAGSAAQAQFFLIAVSFAALTWAFVQKDFSVLYVADNSHSKLPLMYRISAVWGAHEGSLSAVKHVGIAMGIALVLRGTRFHAARNKLYIPKEVASAYKLSPGSVAKGLPSQELSKCVYDLGCVV